MLGSVPIHASFSVDSDGTLFGVGGLGIPTAFVFELADALERLGEGARALAILLELSADAPGYRDVHERVERLSRVHTGE